MSENTKKENGFRYERQMHAICGDNWANGSLTDFTGAMGVAIVQSILDGIPVDVDLLARHVGTDARTLYNAFNNLDMNGAFQTYRGKTRIESDRPALEAKDNLVWCTYAGQAAGITGTFVPDYFLKGNRNV